jgi:dCMP deaminase
MARESWDEYFMGIAKAVATRSTCLKRKVGAIIVSEKRIISTGYNGSAPHLPHCVDVGCLLNEDGKCIRTIHAEANAIANAETPFDKASSTIYCTDCPCLSCLKLIMAKGINRIVYENSFEDKERDIFIEDMVNNALASTNMFLFWKYEKGAAVREIL